MPLALRDPDEVKDYTPYISWRPSVGHFADADGKVEITSEVCLDLPTLQLGWRRFHNGRFEFVADADRTSYTAKPDDDKEWKRGFKVNMLCKKVFGDANPMREWSDDGATNAKAIEAIWKDYEEQCPACDKAAVVRFTGAVPVSFGSSTYKMAGFDLVKLIDRPAELDKNEVSGDNANPSLDATPDTTEDDDEFI